MNHINKVENNTHEIKIEKIVSTERLLQCAEILIEAYKGEPWFDSWTQESAKAILTYHYQTPKFMGWVATSSCGVAGCCIGNIEPHYTGRNFILKELFISPKSQKRGVGKKLLAAMKKDLEVNGVKTVLLFTKKAISDFYIKSGFSEVKGMGMMIYAKNE